MTRDDIIRMARETGIIINSPYLMPHDHVLHGIERFAALVAAAAKAEEREACAKVCDSLHDNIYLVEKTEHYPGEYGSEYDAGQGNAISECADAIRARTTK